MVPDMVGFATFTLNYLDRSSIILPFLPPLHQDLHTCTIIKDPFMVTTLFYDL